MASQFPCPEFLRDCECENFPVRNFTQEEPDQPVFFGHFNQPAQGGTWFAPYCLGTCESFVSQDAADECAARAAVTCSFDGAPSDGNPLPGGGSTAPRFGNNLESCDAECSDGAGTVTAIVPPGTIITATQADADARAHALACKQAERTRVCFATESPLTSGCVGTFESLPILAFGGTPPYTFAHIAGTLPMGMAFDPVGLLSGTPTLAGTYSFDLSVTDDIGTSVVKMFQMQVAEITTSSPLPAASINVAYSQTLAQSGGNVPVTWAVVSGALPPGITLDASTGTLSGTPTAEGVYSFTIQMTAA